MLRQHVTVDGHQVISSTYSVGRGAGRAFVVGRETATNIALAEAFAVHGCDSVITTACGALAARGGDVVLNRLDVLPTVDGVEHGFRTMTRVASTGAVLLNPPSPLLSAHDKLATALLLARAGVPQPRTTHTREANAPQAPQPPFVVKPRFGSWGQDVFRCETQHELRVHLERLAHRHWFRRQGALVQELIPTAGRDLRLLVAAGHVIGAIERIAVPGEWTTNVALGATRRPIEPPLNACELALRAVAALRLDLAGVDLLVDGDGNYVVLEINGAVDFTADYGTNANPFLAAADALLAPRARAAAVAS